MARDRSETRRSAHASSHSTESCRTSVRSEERVMTFHPVEISNFEFVKLSALRTAQLMRGCTPRVPACGKLTTTAQREVAGGKVRGLPRDLNGKPVVDGTKAAE